jgi:hypothetical protein
VPQPVVVNRALHNVPESGMWAWEPGAQFGVYKPETFWLDEQRPLSKGRRTVTFRSACSVFRPTPAGDDPDADRHQHRDLRHHPGAAGRLDRDLYRAAQGAGRSRRSGQDRVPAQTYGLDLPFYLQYLKWAGGLLQCDLGIQLRASDASERGGRRPAVADRGVSLASILFVWVLSFPIAVYSAVRQYSVGDYFFTFSAISGSPRRASCWR